MNQEDQFSIPPAPWGEVEDAIRALAAHAAAGATGGSTAEDTCDGFSPRLVGAMAEIATNAWKAKTRMLDRVSGQVPEVMKRVYRHVESILGVLQDLGVEVKDHTGDAFDYGLPLKVVTNQPTPGITKESVIETIKPTIYWRNQIIQAGEVIIATPLL